MTKDECVECQITTDTTTVHGLHHRWELIEHKADFGAGSKVRQSEVNGISACFDGGVKLWPVPGWGHNFGDDVFVHTLIIC